MLVAYFPMMAVLLLGLRRLVGSVRLGDAECVPVTVIVSARNEERDLPRCIESLRALDYPAGKLQIVLVDDHSTDSTGQIIAAVAAADSRVTAVDAAALPPNGLEAKARGVAYGFTRATGDWVFITDADAAVHPQWIRHMLGRVAPQTGMVGGVVVVDADGALGTVERVSWAYTQLFNLGLAGWRIPFICVGPNMAIRRSVYVEAGGLESVEFRVAEDLALFMMVAHSKTHAGVQSYADAETVAAVRPVPSAMHLISQQRRWLGGGMAEGWVYRVALLAAFWWGFGVSAYSLLGWMLDWRWWVVFVMAKAGVDGIALGMQQGRMRLRHHLRYLYAIELYHLFIFMVLAPSFLVSGRIRWMGDGYSIEYR